MATQTKVDDWYNRFESAKSDGTLPNKSLAQAFRYRRSIIWTVDLDAFGFGFKQAKGGWTVTITNESGSEIFLQQSVQTELLIVFINAGIRIFTWNYVGDHFSTTRVATIDTAPDNIGQFLQGGTALSEQGIADPASGYGTTGETATILFDWLSPIYLFKSPGKPLPPGYKVHVTRDTWNFGPHSVEYQWAFDAGGLPPVASLFDPCGALLTGYSDSRGRIQTGRAWPGNEYRFRAPGLSVKGESPTLLEMPDGRELLTVKTNEGIVEYESISSFYNWRRMKYPDATTGTNTEQIIFDPTATMPTSIRIDGTDNRLHLVQDKGALYSRIVDKAGLGEKIRVTANASDALYGLEQDEQGNVFIIGSAGLPIFKANVFPPRWQPIPQPGQEVAA